MGSPETCPTCGTDRPAAAWYCDFGLPSRFRSHALNGVARDGWALCPDLFHRPTPPAPADARPMVVGGAFVKFDRPAPAPDNAPRVVVEPEGASCWRVWLHINADAWAVGDFRHDKEAAERFAEPLRRALLAAIPGSGDAVKEAMQELGFAPAPDAGAAEDHPSEAKRDHGAEGSDRAVVEALTALRDRFAALITRNPDFGATDWALVEQADAALRGTNQAKRGGDQPKAGREAEGREGA